MDGADFFLNLAHFDLGYHLHALVLVFGRVARQEMKDEVRYPVRSRGERGPLVARRAQEEPAGLPFVDDRPLVLQVCHLVWIKHYRVPQLPVQQLLPFLQP